MTPVSQTKFGREGNCFAACVASLFDEPIDNFQDMFPDKNMFEDDQYWHRMIESGLARRGLQKIEIPINKFDMWMPDGVHVILGCLSPTGLNHTIVGRVQLEIIDGETEINFLGVFDPLGMDLNNYLGKIHSVILLYKLF